MKRIAVFALLVAMHIGWLTPARAQSPGVAEYARTSREMDQKYAKQQNKMMKKAAGKQQKAMKKYAKAQRKAAKKSYRSGR